MQRERSYVVRDGVVARRRAVAEEVADAEKDSGRSLSPAERRPHEMAIRARGLKEKSEPDPEIVGFGEPDERA
jgi:hypothetical protein